MYIFKFVAPKFCCPGPCAHVAHAVNLPLNATLAAATLVCSSHYPTLFVFGPRPSPMRGSTVFKPIGYISPNSLLSFNHLALRPDYIID